MVSTGGATAWARAPTTVIGDKVVTPRESPVVSAAACSCCAAAGRGPTAASRANSAGAIRMRIGRGRVPLESDSRIPQLSQARGRTPRRARAGEGPATMVACLLTEGQPRDDGGPIEKGSRWAVGPEATAVTPGWGRLPATAGPARRRARDVPPAGPLTPREPRTRRRGGPGPGAGAPGGAPLAVGRVVCRRRAPPGEGRHGDAEAEGCRDRESKECPHDLYIGSSRQWAQAELPHDQ